MGDNDNIIRAGIDASDAEQGGRAFEAAVDKINNALKELAQVNANATKSSEALNESIGRLGKTTSQDIATVLQLTHSFNEFDKTLSDISPKSNQFGNALNKSATEMRNANTAGKQLLEGVNQLGVAYRGAVIDAQNKAKADRDEKTRIQDITNALESARRNRANIYNAMKRDEAAVTDARKADQARALSLGASFGSGNLGLRAGIGNLTSGGFSSLGKVGNFAAGAGIGAAASLADAGVGVLTTALHEGASDAFEFNKQIALIKTISKDGSDTTKSWSDALRKLSGDFNISEITVAEGAYQALSNQIIKSSKDTDFLTQSLSLAKSTNSTVRESVDALSSVINSFGKSAGTTQEISDKLFRSVDLGNFRLNEIATSLGRVTSVAKPLGVSFNEVLASLDTVTIKGVKADEALSALSNLYSELLKPSAKLAESMSRLGFVTAQQGIATLGYSGFLKTVIDDSNKFGVSTAELFPNIRGLREALLESQDGFKLYNETLTQVGKSSGATADALKEVRSAAGEETKKALNELKVVAESVWTKFLSTSDDVIRKLRLTDEEAKKNTGIFGLPKGIIERGFEGAPKSNESNTLRQLRLAAEQTGGIDTQHGFQGSKPGDLPVEDANRVDPFEKIFKDRLKTYADFVAKQGLLTKEEISLAQEGTKSHLHALDQRRIASEEFIAKQRQDEGKKQLDANLRLDPGNAKKLIQERIDALKFGSNLNTFPGSDTTGIDQLLDNAKKLKGGDFDKEKGIEDARRQEQEILELKTRQRDITLQSVIDGKASREDLAKAEQELTDEKQAQYDLEVKIQNILKERAAADKAASDAAIERNKKLQAILTGASDISGTIQQQDARKLELANAIPGAKSVAAPGTAAFYAEQYEVKKAARIKQQAADQARFDSYKDKTPADYLSILENGGGIKAPATTAAGKAKEREERIARAEAAMAGNGTKIAEAESSEAEIRRREVEFLRRKTNETNRSKGKISIGGTEESAPDDFGATQTAKALKGVAAGLDDLRSQAERFADDIKHLDLDPNYGSAPQDADSAEYKSERSRLRRRGFADGGIVPGFGSTDSVPAMLTPGERVLTVQENKDFTPIIEAALGGRLRGYSDGGVVNNFNGGINLTVKGGNSSQQTIGEIGRGLERAIRRRTIRLGRY